MTCYGTRQRLLGGYCVRRPAARARGERGRRAENIRAEKKDLVGPGRTLVYANTCQIVRSGDV